MEGLPGPNDYDAPNYMVGYWERVKEDAEKLVAKANRELGILSAKNSAQIPLNLNDEDDRTVNINLQEDSNDRSN